MRAYSLSKLIQIRARRETLYNDGPPLVAVHFSAKYILMIAERCTLYSKVHSYDRGALYTYCQVHSYDRRALYTFCDVHSYERWALYRYSVYIDGTPQNAEHCSAKYIPMTAERCTLFSCTLMVHRRTQNTVLRCTFLWPWSAVHYFRLHWWYTEERRTLFCEVHSYDRRALYTVLRTIDGFYRYTCTVFCILW